MPASRCSNDSFYAGGRKVHPRDDGVFLPDDTPVTLTDREAARVGGVNLQAVAAGTPLRLGDGTSVVYDPATARGRRGRAEVAAQASGPGSVRARTAPANVLPGHTPQQRAERGARMSALVGLYRVGPDGDVQVLHVRTKKAPNGWQTVGGGIDPGESPQEAAVREVREETGWHVDVADLRPVTVVPSDLSQGTITYFMLPAPAGDPSLPFDELEEFRWASFDEAHDLPMFQAGHTFLERAENDLT